MAHALSRVDVGYVSDARKEGEDLVEVRTGREKRDSGSLSTMETIPQRLPLPLPKLEGEGEEEKGRSLSVMKSRCELATSSRDQGTCMERREETDWREAFGWCMKACCWGVRRILRKE